MLTITDRAWVYVRYFLDRCIIALRFVTSTSGMMFREPCEHCLQLILNSIDQSAYLGNENSLALMCVKYECKNEGANVY